EGADGSPPFRCVRYKVEEPDGPDTDDFIKKVHETLSFPKDEPLVGRRVIIVHGSPGVGRGSFFHTISSHFAERSFPPSKLVHGSPVYEWGLFTNATFTTEYSSVIDGLLDFLERCCTSQEDRRRVWIETALSGRFEEARSRKTQLTQRLSEVKDR